MLRRLEYLIDMIHEWLDCDDLNRSIQRDEKLSDMLTVHLNELQTKMEKELKDLFVRIHQTVANKSSSAIQPGNDDALRQALANQIERELSVNQKEIEQIISECQNDFCSKLENNPALIPLIRSLGERRLSGDPYRAVIGQYRNVEDDLFCSAKVYHAAPSVRHIVKRFLSSFVSVASIPILSLLPGMGSFMTSVRTFSYSLTANIGIAAVTDGISLIRARQTLLNQAQAVAESSTETILSGLITEISNHIHETLHEQLSSISEDIRKRKAKLGEQKETGEALHIAEFLKENASPILQLYLNLLDRANRLVYPRCEINLGDELGRSNFPVFAGELGDVDRIYSEKIAAKRVPLNSFTWQEVRYMNELKHENILLYYGVRKSEHLKDHYDILMQRLDSDLTKYIDHVSKKRKVNNKLMDDIFIQITKGLTYLHEQGLIHRDMKPANVLVQIRKGQPPVFVIADFGFVHRVTISIKGTAGFMAPELLVNNTHSTFITAKIDIFALGATIRQTLDKSRVDTNDKYVQFWTEISRRCQLNDPYQRPTCQQILEEHGQLLN